jgi:hypothetical protein
MPEQLRASSQNTRQARDGWLTVYEPLAEAFKNDCGEDYAVFYSSHMQAILSCTVSTFIFLRDTVGVAVGSRSFQGELEYTVRTILMVASDHFNFLWQPVVIGADVPPTPLDEWQKYKDMGKIRSMYLEVFEQLRSPQATDTGRYAALMALCRLQLILAANDF